jgi:serine/threonine protein kinase
MFVLVMPCATDGALDDHIKTLKTLSPHRRELRALQYASDLADGIDYLHSKGFVQ